MKWFRCRCPQVLPVRFALRCGRQLLGFFLVGLLGTLSPLGSWAKTPEPLIQQGPRSADTSIQAPQSRPFSQNRPFSPPIQELSGDRPSTVQQLEQEGVLLLQRGQAQQALERWQRAAALYPPPQQWDSALRLAYQTNQLNQAKALQAAGFYRRANGLLKELVKELLPPLQGPGWHTLGDNLTLLGEFEPAQRALNQAWVRSQPSVSSPSQPTDSAQASAVAISLGNLAQAQQRPAAALDYYRQAELLATSPLPRLKAAVNRLQVRDFLERDFLERDFLERDFLERDLPGPEPSAPRAGTNESSQLLTARQVMLELQQLPPSLERAYIQIRLAVIGTQMVSTPDPALTRTDLASLLAEAIAQAEQLQDTRAHSYGLGLLGHLYEQSGQWQQAQRLTVQSLNLAQQVQAADLTYRWQWQLGRLEQQQGHRAAAIAAYDQAIRDLQSLRSDLVAVSREVQFTFRDSVEPVYRQAVALRLEEDTPSQQDLNQARSYIEALQLAELDNFFQEACLDRHTVALDQLVDQQSPTTAIFYPILLGDRLEVIVKIPHQPLHRHRVTLPQGQIQAQLAQIRQRIGDPSRKSSEIKQQTQAVYRWLIQPVASQLAQGGVKTLVFVLDQDLRNIPMAALYDGQQYLIERYAVALSPGLELTAAQNLAQARPQALSAGLETFPGFEELPAVGAELNQITQAGFPNATLLNQAFTSSALAQTLQRRVFQIVHLATHGQFSSRAEDTFLLAADGKINVTQLDQLLRQRTPIDLLVLSACQTAVGDNRATLGLAGVAIRAGARSTMASLWRVHDSATKDFIGFFYRALAQGNITKAEALRQAQLALMQQQEDYARPAYWAAYVLVGNWL